MKKTITRSLLAGIGMMSLALFTNVGSAAVLITLDSSNLATVPGGEAASVGFQFTVGDDPIEITHLGYLINRGVAENSDDTDVGIWADSGGAALVTITIANGAGGGSAVVDGFRYASLTTPLELNANTTYRIAANRAGGEWGFHPNTYSGLTSGAGVTYDSIAIGGFNDQGGGPQGELVFPNNTGPTRIGDFGANAQYNVIPEPTSLSLLGFGLGSLVLLRRRR